MITLKFIQNSKFSTDNIPEQWLPNVSVRLLRDPSNKLVVRSNVAITVQEDDSSYRYRALMERPKLTLKFSLPFFVEFPVGTYCTYMNQTYYLNRPEDLKKQGTRKIEYTMELGTLEDNLSLYKIRNTVDGRLKWSMCATPREFLEEIVKNMNEREGDDVWKVHETDVIEATAKTIEFNHAYCDEALEDVAETFDTEYEISNDFTISLHKVEYNKDNPLALAYGKGNGFVPGIGRSASSDDMPVKRLYVQGGDTNIDRSTYGDTFNYSNNPAELRLPKSQSLEYEGRTYTTDEEGYYIERTDSVSDAVKEDSLDCSEIYPSRIGTVSAVEWPNAAKNYCDIIDNTIPDTLDFSSDDNLIDGETLTIIFQSGMLAGDDKEFEVKYKHADRRFEIVPQEIDGVTMPNETFKPEVGDTYAIFGCSLPKEYICDNENKVGAAWDMFNEAAKYLYDNEEQKFTFTGELQALWAKKNWENVGGKLIVGGYVLFTDNQFAPNGTLIRITGIKDYLTTPYSPTVEISNSVSGGTSLSSSLRQIDQTEVTIEDTKKQIIQYTKRRFRDALETLSMLEDAQLEGFTNSINPVAIQTMQLLIGDENLQFSLGTSSKTIGGEDYVIGFDNETQQFHAAAGVLQHYTLGISSITAERTDDNTGYLTWPMNEFTSAVLDDESKAYYVYAVVNRQDETHTTAVGEFILSTKAIAMREVAGYYHLLVGIISSSFDGERSFEKMYGFTELLPGRITTDIIKSTDGKTYFDLVNGIIAGTIKFRNSDGELEDVVTLNSNLLQAISDGDKDAYDEAVEQIKQFGETIIEGGYIKTELIKTTEIVANHVSVENDDEDDARKITISPDTMSMDVYDENGDICSTFEGMSYDSLDKLFGDSSGSVSIIARTSKQYGFASGVTLGRGQLDTLKLTTDSTSKTYSPNKFPISEVWHTDTPTEVIIAQGYLYIKAYSSRTTTSSSSSTTTAVAPMMQSRASGTINILVGTYEDEDCTVLIERKAIAYLTASSLGDGLISGNSYTDTKTLDLATTKPSIKTSAGYHRLELYVYQEVNGKSGNYVELAWGNYDSSHNDLGAITYKSDFYVSRFFANGFCLGERKDNYVVVLKTDNGMQFAAQNGNYGIKCSESGVQMYNGTQWMPVPLLMLHARCAYTSSSTSYSFNSYTVYDGTLPTLSRINKGHVRIFFPTSWGSFSISKYIVNVVGASPIDGGTNPNKAQIYAINTAYIDVTISDDDSTNDGDFVIDILKLG